jgi:hypothetical protein
MKKLGQKIQTREIDEVMEKHDLSKKGGDQF